MLTRVSRSEQQQLLGLLLTRFSCHLHHPGTYEVLLLGHLELSY
jgi:hypothetical protein